MTRFQAPFPAVARLFLACLLLLAAAVSAETRHATPPVQAIERTAADPTIDDGPYATYLADGAGLTVTWLCRGMPVRKRLARTGGAVIEPECGYPKPITIRDEAPTFPVPARFTAKRVAALSDVHGQFDVMVRLLQANGVIDREMKWSFGEGHLVVIGDMFDRGPKVTEVLWLLYQLEAEARAAGGALHVMLGNHEAMVLYDDLRYIHPRYAAVAKGLNDSYPGLFGDQTVLGRWLRAKPFLLQVNDMLFVHGGLNPEYAALKLGMQETNEAFRASLGQPRTTVRATPLPAFLYGSRGPIWYRGYFREPLIDSAELDRLLTQYGVKRIVVGHTTLSGVFSHYDGRVINTDTDIQTGAGGELFLWTDGRLARGTMRGEQLPLTEYARRAEAGAR